MQQQAIQDAENDFLERECQHLQKLLLERDQELAELQTQPPAADSDANPDSIPPTAALDTDTAMQSSSTPLDPEPGLKDHKAMHEAYQFVVSAPSLLLSHCFTWPGLKHCLLFVRPCLLCQQQQQQQP